MRFINGRLVFGLVVLVVGVLLLLNNLNIGVQINIRDLLQYWPVILLILGLNWLFLSFGSTSGTEGSKAYFSWGHYYVPDCDSDRRRIFGKKSRVVRF